MAEAKAAREEALAFWQQAPLPWGRVEVPDAGIQALVDSSIRNIWQAREIKNGLPAFQVGPTCYRGLWIVDGAFLLEAATMLGAGDQARNGVAYELTHQKPDGRIEVMKDNRLLERKRHRALDLRPPRDVDARQGVARIRVAELERIAGFIKLLRTDRAADQRWKQGCSRTKHTSLDEGLMPHGIIDGGIQRWR